MRAIVDKEKKAKPKFKKRNNIYTFLSFKSRKKVH